MRPTLAPARHGRPMPPPAPRRPAPTPRPARRPALVPGTRRVLRDRVLATRAVDEGAAPPPDAGAVREGPSVDLRVIASRAFKVREMEREMRRVFDSEH